MSTSGQPQFRYTQTPSKVLHLRNLPWECIEEELVELCKPFGRIVNTKCNVGSNRNQAFVEFADLNQAINMATYYASSSEPAQIRGKTVYIQYSNRHEIVNNKSPGDIPGNVLLVTIEGVEAGDVSIDVIHLVFSAFGFVHKIATFEKAAGFQALVQFTDIETAATAREALDGRSIPRHALFGADGKKKEPESNVLLASIENMQYAVTVDVLHTVFSAFGTVQKIAIFEKNGGTQAFIQYPDVATATVAKDALEGHCIYDGGYCKLHLSYSRHTDLNVKAYSDKSRDYRVPESGLPPLQQASALPNTAPAWQNHPQYVSVHSAPPATMPMQNPWDPTMQGGRPAFIFNSNHIPGRIEYASPPFLVTLLQQPNTSPLFTHFFNPTLHLAASQPLPTQGHSASRQPSLTFSLIRLELIDHNKSC
nr:polypyrimidine tract-binding protein homolog 1 isoform X1 [Ipomoea batatas]